MKPASHHVGLFDLVVCGLFLLVMAGGDCYFNGVNPRTIVAGLMFIALCVWVARDKP